MVHTEVYAKMPEHGAELEKDFKNQGCDGTFYILEKDIERNGIAKNLHGKTGAPVVQFEHIVDCRGSSREIPANKGFCDHLLNTGLIEETFSLNHRPFNEDIGGSVPQSEFHTARGSSRKIFYPLQGLCCICNCIYTIYIYMFIY